MVQFNDEYFIDVESRPICYTLKRRSFTKPKDGGEPKERFAVLGYFSTVEGVLRGLHEQIVADALSEGFYSLTEALTAIVEKRREVICKINELLDGIRVEVSTSNSKPI